MAHSIGGALEQGSIKSTTENVCHEDENDSTVGMQAWIIVFILGQACSQIKWSLTFTNCHQLFCV